MSSDPENRDHELWPHREHHSPADVVPSSSNESEAPTEHAPAADGAYRLEDSEPVPVPLAASAFELRPPADPATPVGFDIAGGPMELQWRSETASTAEGAIVAEATTPLLRQLGVWRDEIFAWVRTLLSAAVYAVLIVTFGFQVARVEGQSMSPTLSDQDRLIVNKLAYRLGPPRREDIVMLYYPPDPDKSFVKRVIAEEGQLIKIEDGRVFVNDVPIDDDYVPAEYRSHDDFPPTVVKEGYYFVMGDHRNNSSDSRIWGEVPKKYIIGKVQLRWWPIPHARLF